MQNKSIATHKRMLLLILSFLFVLKFTHSEPANGLVINPTNGIIFHRTESVIIAETYSKFSLFIEYSLPQLNVTHLSSNCGLRGHNIRAVEDIREQIYEDLYNELNLTLAGEVEVTQLHDFAHSLMHKPKRHKRAFKYLTENYWTLSGWTEDRLASIERWTNGTLSATQTRLNDMGVILNRQSKALGELQHKLCAKVNVDPAAYFELAVTEILSKLEIDLSVAEQGILPLSVTADFLADFCKVHFRQNRDSKLCLGNSRKLFEVQSSNLSLDTKRAAIVVGLEVLFPSTPKLEYDIFRVSSIPVFRADVPYPIQVRIPSLYFIVNVDNKNFEDTLLFSGDSCAKHGKTKICSELADVADNLCLRQTWFGKVSPDMCQSVQLRTNSTCFSRRLKHSFVLSTSTQVEVHSIPNDKNKIF